MTIAPASSVLALGANVNGPRRLDHASSVIAFP